MGQESLLLISLICIVLSHVTAQSPTSSPTPQASPPPPTTVPPPALTPAPLSYTPAISPALAPENVKSKAPALAPDPISPASEAPAPTLSSIASMRDHSGLDKLMVGSFAVFGCALLSLLL